MVKAIVSPISALLNGSQYFVNGALYNALGKITNQPLGNGLTTVFSYFGNTLDSHYDNTQYFAYGLLSRIQTGTIQDQALGVAGSNWTPGYDRVGNIQTIVNSDTPSETLSFTYNELDELISFSGAASGNETYGYGAAATPKVNVGNILTKSSATYAYPAAGATSGGTPPSPWTPIYAPNSAGSVTLGYDSNGNRTSDSLVGAAYTYDVENRLTMLTNASVLANTYDGDGTRVVRSSSGVTTHYVGPWYENNVTSGVVTAYYPFNGTPVAMKKGTTLSYLHHDHLGSLVAVTGGNGAAVWQGRYTPYGILRSSSGMLTTDRLFTGQIRDWTSDRFYFFKARYYDATIGKFQTADTVAPEAGKPRGLNRYAYGFNNPMRFNDPSGPRAATAGDDLDWSPSPSQPATPTPVPTYVDAPPASANISPTPVPVPTPVVPPAPPAYGLDPHPPQCGETVYEVHQSDGYWFSVHENVTGLKRTILDKLNAPAATILPGEIWSATLLSPGSSLYSHEGGHLDQQKILGFLYVPAYGLAWLQSELAARGDPNPLAAHRINIMEQGANRNGGLPPTFDGGSPDSPYNPFP